MSKPEIKIKNSELAGIKDAIILLEAGQRIGPVASTGLDGKPLMRQGDMQPVLLHTYPPDHKRFVFLDEGGVRYKFGRALRDVEKAMRTMDQRRTEFIETAMAMQKNDEKFKDHSDLVGPYLNAFREDYQDLLDQETTIELLQVPMSKVDIEKNAVPATILSALLDVVIVDDTGDKFAN